MKAAYRSRWLEWRAGRIADPVERLRYLREAARERPSRTRFAWRGDWLKRWVVPIVGVGLVLAPRQSPVGGGALIGRERRMLAAIAATAPEPISAVWLVERGSGYETYSNGLRIETQHAIKNRPRSEYPIFDPAFESEPKRSAEPVGIVFHTTESHLVPFEPDKNSALRRLARGVADLVKQQRSYHYLIDRFGRVSRIVEESDAAHHAGVSVWSDGSGVYVNLNDSFLGVAFEGQTRPEDSESAVSAAQVNAARALTAMLRARYRIPARNCVTHAQVSVNAQNFLIGNHVDWAAGFPFADLGLPNNYDLAPAALWAFGFEYDSVFLDVSGGSWKGLDRAISQVRDQATAEGLPVSRYKKILRERYREITAALKENSGREVDPK